MKRKNKAPESEVAQENADTALLTKCKREIAFLRSCVLAGETLSVEEKNDNLEVLTEIQSAIDAARGAESVDLVNDYPPPVTDREIEQFLHEYYEGKHPVPQAFKDALKKAEPAFKAQLAKIYSGGAESAAARVEPATGDPLKFEGWSKFFLRKREELKLSQTEMSSLLGCGLKSYCRWENDSQPTEIVIRALLRLLAIRQILNESFQGHNAGCLHCAEINEIADHAWNLDYTWRVSLISNASLGATPPAPDAETGLLPCPFCGSEAQFGIDGHGGECVECCNPMCSASSMLVYPMKEGAKPKLIEVWNTRASLPTKPTQ